MREIIFILSFLCLASTRLSAQTIDEQPPGAIRDSILWDSIVYWFKEDHNLCTFYLKKGLKQYKQSGNHEYYINCRLGLSNIYHGRSEFILCQKQIQETKKEALKLLGEDTEGYRNVLNMEAEFDETLGNYTKALEGYEAIIRMIPEDKVSEKVYYLQALSRINTLRGDYQESLIYLNKVARMIIELQKKDSRTNENFLSVENLRDIGRIHIQLQQFDTAIHILKKAQQTLHKGTYKKGMANRYEMGINNTLSEAYLKKGDVEKSLYYSGLNFQLSYSNQSKALAIANTLKGKAYLEKGEFKRALQYFQTALEIKQEIYKEFTKHPSLAGNFQQLANLHVQTGADDQALQYLQDALFHASDTFQAKHIYALPASTDLVQNYAFLNILKEKAKVLHHKFQNGSGTLEDLQAALQTCTLAHDFLRELYQKYEAEGSKLSLYQNALSIYGLGIEVASQLYETTHDETYLSKAWQFADYSKAAMLREALNENLAAGLGQVPDSLLNREKDLNTNINFYTEQISLESHALDLDEEKLNQYREDLFELKRQKQDLKTLIQSNYPEYFEYKYDISTVDLKALQDHLQMEKALLLEYFIGENKVFVFGIDGKKLQLKSFEIKSFDLGQISQLRHLISKEPDAESFDQEAIRFYEAAYQLYDRLVAPLLEADHLEVDKLIVVPDRDINYIPFGLLLSQNPPPGSLGFSPVDLHYLLENYNLSYAYSATQLIKSRQGAYLKGKQGFIGFAPSFNGLAQASRNSCISGQPLGRLHHNESEVKKICDIIPGEYYKGEQASKSAFLQEASNYRIVHLATHACVDPDNPQFNKIFFTDDDLGHFDLQHLDINADLVVLSACNSGMGKLQAGEGLMSLSRSFHIAGCKSSIMSLWPVDDSATSQLMQSFYRYLKTGQGKDQALKNAKLEYLSQTDIAGSHPYYWGPFVLFGSSEALDLAQPFAFKYIGMTAIIILLTISFWILRRSKNHR